MYAGKGRFGTWLAYKLNSEIISVYTLGDALNMSSVAIRNHLKMNRIPSYESLDKYSAYFGKDLQMLIDMVEGDYNKKVKNRRITEYKGEFGKLLHDAAVKRGLSLSELAYRIGIDDDTLRRHLQMKSHPYSCSIEKYALYFKVSIIYLTDMIDKDWSEVK